MFHIFLYIHPGGNTAGLRDNSCYNFTHSFFKFRDFFFWNDVIEIWNLKIYSTNEKKSKDQEKYYQELNAFHDAQFALESRNVELSAVTNSNIQILQKRLEQAKQNMHNLEEQQRQNERDLKELQHYQKKIDTYLGKKHEDI